MSDIFKKISSTISKLLNDSDKKPGENQINEDQASAIQADLSERGKVLDLSEADKIRHYNDNKQSYYDLWDLSEVTRGRCLDVGSYHGYMWDYAPKDIKIYGLNIVKEDHEVALKRVEELENVVETKMGSMEAIPYEDDFFNVIYCKQTLEHSYDLHKSLPEMKRVLISGGKLLIEVPINLGFDPAHLADIDGSPDVKEKYWLEWISKDYHIEKFQRKDYFFCLALQIIAVK